MIIGIVGEAGSGKDTVAAMVLKSTGAVKVAFADPLKEFCRDVFGFTDHQLWGPSEARNAPDPRFIDRSRTQTEGLWKAYLQHAIPWLKRVLPRDYDLVSALEQLDAWMMLCMRQPTLNARVPLQLLGTEFGRAISPTIWLDAGLLRVKNLVESGRLAVISDCRFLNEIQGLKDAGARIWRIQRSSLSRDVERAGVAGHASETELSSPEALALVDTIIQNDGDLADLEAMVAQALTV